MGGEILRYATLSRIFLEIHFGISDATLYYLIKYRLLLKASKFIPIFTRTASRYLALLRVDALPKTQHASHLIFFESSLRIPRYTVQ